MNHPFEAAMRSEPMLRKLKGELARRSGVFFSLRTFRTTFAQRAKDLGVSIEAVSRALRHASTEPTEAFYARIRADDAFHEIEKAFDEPKVRARRGVAENPRSATAPPWER